MATFNFEELSDHSLATEFKRRYGTTCFIVVNSTPYYWTGFYWNETDAKHQMSMYLSEKLYADLDMEATVEILNTVELLKAKKNLISKLRNCKAKEQIIKEIICVMNDNTIQMDNKPDLFVFHNAVFDLKTGEQIQPNQQDYLSQSAEYQYRKPTAEETEELTNVICQILPVEEERTYYLQLMATGLGGHLLDKFIMANNSGGNGKNVIHDLIRTTLGNYSYKGSSITLQEQTQAGARPEIASMNKKRFILFSEPDAKKPLCGAVIKELTGDRTINARMLYSNEMDTTLVGTYVMMCNHRPKFDEINDAIERRLVDFPFRASFMERSKIEELSKFNHGKEMEFIHEKNPYYNDYPFREKIKYAMFHILLDHYKMLPVPMPATVRERSRQYLQGCDEFYYWFQENNEYVEAEPRCFVSITGLFNDVKKADFYEHLSRDQKRAFTKRGMIDTIKENIYLKRHYCEKFQPIIRGQQLCLRNVIMDYRHKKLDMNNEFEYL